jgi:ribulose-phosphate 3-epimerase
MVKWAPSILAADFLRLGAQAEEVEHAGADRFHIDIMDGHFVPNLSLGVPIVEAMRRATSLPLEVHLMIVHPEQYLEAFVQAGSNILIVHQEATPQLHRALDQVKMLGRQVGVALNPATPVSMLEPVIEEIDVALIMTVDPGFGGQRFLDSMLPKLRTARHMIDAHAVSCDLEVDGGIDDRTAALAIEHGANVLVAGTSVFEHPEGPTIGLRRLMTAVGQCAMAGRQTC